MSTPELQSTDVTVVDLEPEAGRTGVVVARSPGQLFRRTIRL